MNAPLVTVSRLTVNCTVARDHPDLDRVRRRLDEVAGALHEALAVLLAPLAKIHDDQVIIIRQLGLDFELDLSGTVPDLAMRFAARVAAAIARVLEDQPSANGVVRFSDSAHFLAYFLLDATRSRSPTQWFFARYRGWQALALPALLRCALLEDAECGLAALRWLNPSELILVLQAIGPEEALRITHQLSEGPSHADDIDAAVEPLLRSYNHWFPVARALSSAWSAGLALLALASQSSTSVSLSSIARLSASVAAWAYAENGFRAGHRQPSPQELGPLAALSLSRREQLAATFGIANQAPAPASIGVTMYTPFGGLLLLLPHLVALGLDAIWRDAEQCAWARLFVLARASGSERHWRVLSDSVMHRACGLSGSAGTASEWLAANTERIAGELGPFLDDSVDLAEYFVVEPPVSKSIPAERVLVSAARRVLSDFARRLPGFSESSPAFLYDNFLAFSAALDTRDGVIACRLGCPKLAALLGITGALRGRIVVPWLEPLELHSGG